MKRILKWIFRIVLVLFILAFLFVFVAYWRSTNNCDQLTATQGDKMKAIVYCDYGLANLKLAEIAKPTPTDDQILVKVHAASVNPLDWHFIEGTPKIMRAMGVGLGKPMDPRLGVDFAGTVEAVGKNVTQFKAGDEVFGGRDGAFAEYICPRTDRAVALKPANITFEQAASVNIAGITALQALRDKGRVQPGQTVLINGASGGVGTFAVQIAKSLGAEVTGVCSTRNVDLVRSLGADHVVDYTREDFTRSDRRYDVLLDVAGSRRWSECKRVLEPRARVVMVGAPKGSRLLGPLRHLLATRIVAIPSGRQVGFFVAKFSKADVEALRELLEAGTIRSVVDRRYPLSDVADAFRCL